MVVFENSGEIDVLSISSFGVSVKDGDSPIGFFGTGLKYAIAVLLRHKQSITAYCGLTEVKFHVIKRPVRGVEFSFVAMKINGGESQTLGFTTELGKGWQLWMAYREIACNCKDEGGSIHFGDAIAESGKTKFIVCGDLFDVVAQNADQFILNDAADSQIGSIEVRKRGGNAFFYRGVRVQEFGKPGIYTYNQTGFLELTEDRTVKNQNMPFYDIARAVMQSKDRQFLRDCITASDSFAESHLDFDGWSTVPSVEFLEVIGECIGSKITNVNQTALKVWKKSSRKNFAPREIELTKVQSISASKAVSFCKKLGFQVDQYPIKFIESLGDGTLGLAEGETIYIAERVFHLGGTKQLASTLIEEFLHLRHGWKDMSREMQSFLFDKLVSVGEELTGEPL